MLILEHWEPITIFYCLSSRDLPQLLCIQVLGLDVVAIVLLKDVNFANQIVSSLPAESWYFKQIELRGAEGVYLRAII